jgi:AcrR family transcriptional regulator
MPRVGLNTEDVVRAGAELADERGLASLTLAALAERLGVRAPALYNHVEGIADLQHRIATLAMTELGDALRDRLQGKSGIDAIGALFETLQAYVAAHPGRYGATTGAAFHGDADPLRVAAARVIDSLHAALSGYGLPAGEIDHAIRGLRCTFHGYALLQAQDGFQWPNDPAASADWMVRFIDSGLTSIGSKA